MAFEEIVPQLHRSRQPVESSKEYKKKKNLVATLLFIAFSKPFDSILRGKMKQILHPYRLLKETVTAIMMFYKNTKANIRLHDGDIDFFDIVAGIFQGNIFAPH